MTAPLFFRKKISSGEGPQKRSPAPAMDGSENVRPGPQKSTIAESISTSARVADRGASKDSADVGAVVSKAKKAAASLWMMLHAQRCRAGTYQCKYKGCAQAKLVLFHIKECKAGPGEECPVQYQGCTQTRKLLAHYDQCREIRARQTRQKPSLRGSVRQQQQQHTCLVCSLVARHARNVLEGGKAPVVTSGKTRRVISSFSLSKTKISPDTTSVIVPANLISSSSEKAMPPPPTRRPQNPRLVSTDPEESNFSSSLPSSSELMSREITAVAAAASTQGGNMHQSMLGKSLDSTSTYMNKMDALLKATQEVDEHQVGRYHQRRLRAESYDAGSGRSKLQQSVQLPQEFVGGQRNDPTLEVMLTSEDRDVANQELRDPLYGRKRSASLGVLLEVSRCATILEEGGMEEGSDAGMDQPFPMEDDVER